MAHKPREIHFYYIYSLFKIIAQLWVMIVMIHLLLVGCTPKCDRQEGFPSFNPKHPGCLQLPLLRFQTFQKWIPKSPWVSSFSNDFGYLWGYLWLAPWLEGNLHDVDPRPRASASATHSGRKPWATHSRAKAAYSKADSVVDRNRFIGGTYLVAHPT